MAPFRALLASLTASVLLFTSVVNSVPTPHLKAEVAPNQARQSEPSDVPCTYGNFGLKLPKPGTIVTQLDDGNYDGTTLEVLYCSSQYFKTRSLSATIGLADPGSYTTSGQILGQPGMGPTAGASSAGYYGYHVNVTVYPLDGNYIQGVQTLSVLEVATGYYNAYNYEVASVNITFEVQKVNSKV